MKKVFRLDDWLPEAEPREMPGQAGHDGHEKGYLIQEHDENGHVFYYDFKIRRAERGEHPEGEDMGGQDHEN